MFEIANMLVASCVTVPPKTIAVPVVPLGRSDTMLSLIANQLDPVSTKLLISRTKNEPVRPLFVALMLLRRITAKEPESMVMTELVNCSDRETPRFVVP